LVVLSDVFDVPQSRLADLGSLGVAAEPAWAGQVWSVGGAGQQRDAVALEVAAVGSAGNVEPSTTSRSRTSTTLLTASATRTYCPYKGDASYYGIAAADGERADAVWSYREPYDVVADIVGHVAFYTGRVDVVVGT
jgi:hypothetical protein